MKCDTFRRAVEAFDLDATVATFSPSIVLRFETSHSRAGRRLAVCSQSSFESSRTQVCRLIYL